MGTGGQSGGDVVDDLTSIERAITALEDRVESQRIGADLRTLRLMLREIHRSPSGLCLILPQAYRMAMWHSMN